MPGTKRFRWMENGSCYNCGYGELPTRRPYPLATMEVAAVSVTHITLPIDYLRECVCYCHLSGRMVWRERPRHHFKTARGWKNYNTRFAGRLCGNIASNGYREVKINGTSYKAHRIAWAWTYGEFPPEDIDHRNRRRDDNRLTNLRLASRSENTKNTSKKSNNTSGVTGTHWHKRDAKWVAYIQVDGKHHHLGYFETLEDAAEARQAANRKYGFSPTHGE